jgi:hypothetical protein
MHKKNETSIMAKVPFQILLLDSNYSKRYCLPQNRTLIVTHLRYSKNDLRYSLQDELFDFPWDENACEILHMFYPN